MFDNIGRKIKYLSVFACWFGVAMTVIYGAFLVFKLKDFAGLLWILGGPCICWTGSFTLYGFGQLVENSDTVARMSKALLDNSNSINNKLNSNEMPYDKDLPNPYENGPTNESVREQIMLLNKALDQGRITEEKYLKILDKINNVR